MRLSYILLFCLVTVTLTAQKLGPYTISSTGQAFESDEVDLYVSIGEPINTVLSDGEISVSQGILQVIFQNAEPANPLCATNTAGTLFFDNCDDGTLYFFIRTPDGKIYDPYYASGVGFEHEEGEVKVNFGFVDANFATPCSVAEKAILITCIEAEIVSSNSTILTEKTNFQVHPNPSKNTIKLLLDKPSRQIFKLQIFDLQGKEVWRKTEVINEDLVDISSLPAGIYHLLLTNDLQQRQTIKLVKQ